MDGLDGMFKAIEESEEFKEWDKKNETTKKLLSRKEVLLAMGKLAAGIVDIAVEEKKHSMVVAFAAIEANKIVKELFREESEEKEME